MIIDGAQGEGGGQVLRSSLALSALSQTEVRIENVRAKRSKPGLLRQHLTALRAIAQVCHAQVTGDELGSRSVTFAPGECAHGDYHFAVGTAGSATLVFQTVLPPLLAVEGTSRLVFEGGTHNPWAPPFDFLSETFLPLLHRIGVTISAELERPGFYPAGGGRFVVRVSGGSPLAPLSLLERGAINRVRARATVSGIPEHVAHREVTTLATLLSDLPIITEIVEVASAGPGNVATVTVRSAALTETFSAFGKRGVSAEKVAHQLAGEVRRYIAANVPVGEHLADQLLMPLLAGGGGEFRSMEPTLHTRTNAEVINAFTPGRVAMSKDDVGWLIRVT